MTDYPRKWEDLTPEQQAAVTEFWQQLAENMRNLREAFTNIVVACADAVRGIEAVEWWESPGDSNEPDPGDSP